MNKKTFLLIAAVCIHIVHTAMGLPVEGFEQVLIAAAQD